MTRTMRNGRTAQVKPKNDSRNSHLALQSRFRPCAHRLAQPGERRCGTRAYTKAINGYEVRRRTFATLELLQSILVHLPAKQLYSVQCVSSQFRQAILGCPLIRDKMYLNRSTNPRESWKLVKGGHTGIHFRSVGHWLFMHRPQDPAGPMFQALTPSDLQPLRTFTPAVLHPVFENGSWNLGARKEALRSAPVVWLNGAQRWVSSVMMPATSEYGTVGAKGVFLDAYTSDPPCCAADVRVSHEMRSGIFCSTKNIRIQSADGLKIRDVYNALRKLSRALYRKAYFERKQNLIKRELKIFMPSDIHPVTTQEWEEVRNIQKSRCLPTSL